MIGSIIGDICGSIYEFQNDRRKDIELFKAGSSFTDDTVMTVATARAILEKKEFGPMYHGYGNMFPGRGYGGMFKQWLASPTILPAYNSYGNGSAMRVSPIGFLGSKKDDVDTLMALAKLSAECTHSHPEGIKGAQAITMAIYLANKGKSKAKIKSAIEKAFQYDLNFSIAELSLTYKFNETCQGSVPQAIVCFLESENFEDAIRNTILLGGDCDTTGAMVGGIAQAFYKGIPNWMLKKMDDLLEPQLAVIAKEFSEKYEIQY